MVDLSLDRFAGARQQVYGKKRFPKTGDAAVQNGGEKDYENESADLAEGFANAQIGRAAWRERV